jgi:hypothetical protein
MAANQVVIFYIYRGEEGEPVPVDATHITVHESVTVIPRRAFYQHPNIVEFKCHDCVETIEGWAFSRCPSLRRVQMPGVKAVERHAFYNCNALTDGECDKLERIGWGAFLCCESLRNINLRSIKIVEEGAFSCCVALTDLKFGDKLESVGELAFVDCTTLERITIPLNDSMITYDNIFAGCYNMKHVDLVGGVHETIAALHLEDWRNDMNEAIDAINHILPNTPAGRLGLDNDDEGGKGQAVKQWIRSVLRKLVDYKQQYRNLLTEATTILVEDLALLPRDIVLNNVLPFLELPSYTFEGEEEEDEEEEDRPIRRQGLLHLTELIIGRVIRSFATWRS